MNLAIPSVALCMLMSVEVAFCASLKDADRTIVKRDVDIIPAIMGGAVDMTLDLIDKFGKGYGIRGSSKFDAFGLHDEKKFEVGASDAAMPQEREKRSAVPCRNGTTNGSNSNINTRNANNPDVETLARRKRSAQSYEPPNGFQQNEQSPNGPPSSDGMPPNGPPPGMPPNGCPPPPNGPHPDGPPPDGMRPPPGLPPNCTRPGEGASQNGQSNAQIEEPNLERVKRTPSQNAPRPKRSPQRPNDDFPPQQNETRYQLERDNKNHGPPQGQNDNRNPNGYGGDNGNRNFRKKRSAKPCNGQNGNGLANGVPTNSSPQLSQLPQQQQQPTTGSVNIGDLQRDQNERTRRDVNDFDKVLPATSADDKNLFDRVMQVTKEVFSRVARWIADMDKDMSDSKMSSEKPKL